MRFKKCEDIEGSLILHLGASGSIELRYGFISGDVKAVRTAGEADGASARAAAFYVSCGGCGGFGRRGEPGNLRRRGGTWPHRDALHAVMWKAV